MDGHVIIDRRLNPKDRNLSNRRRFVDRIREQVRESARKKLTGKGLRDKNDTKVSVPIDGIAEPRFQHDRDSGEHDYVLPGNKQFSPGDKIRKPPRRSGGGSQAGEGDDFEFALSHDEYISIVFDDLDLPDMVKASEKAPTSVEYRRAGYSVAGSPSTLDVERTLGKSLARRIALKAPKMARIRELEEEAARLTTEGGHDARIAEIIEEIARLRIAAAAVQFLDPVDLRYRRFEPKPRPGPRAVMFCVDGETEYLSPTGWRAISGYDGGKVAQYSKDGLAEFVTPQAFIKREESRPFIRLKAQGIDQKLTPEHRVIYRRSRGGALAEMTAAELMERHNGTRFGFRGSFVTHFKSSGSDLPMTDDEIRFHVAFKADGGYQTEHGYRAQFIFHKQRKADRLRALLTRLGWDHNETGGVESGVFRFYVTTPTRIGRNYPSEWYEMSDRQLSLIADEIVHWDGHATRGTFTTRFASDADFVQFVYASQGFGTNIVDAGDVLHVCRSTFSERTLSGNPKREITEEEGDGMAYCFSVPSGMLLLRRGGKIFVTGNCLMDVSGSMGERERTIAKRFFMLLSLFLQRRYADLDIVFIRHHHNAEEVDEDTFFGTGSTGGTVVSMAYRKAEEVLAQRYPVAEWNIYFAQASDGDNMDNDTPEVQACMKRLLALSQYYAYIEIGRDATGSFFHHDGGNVTTLWRSLAGLRERNKNLSMRQVNDDDEVIGVFRSLFDGSAERATP
jgi:uncharacterized sporulation protein YeaH/YhbH (DUF444 family)